MNDEPAELLTIPEAAPRLGITERTLRRLLARPEYAAQTRQVTRQTVTGTRTAAALSPPLMEALQSALADGPKAAEKTAPEYGANADKDAAQSGATVAEGGDKAAERGRDAAEGTVPSAPVEAAEGILPAALYQKVIADKDAEIGYLRGQLNMAQENVKAAHSALAREQSLRLLTGPVAEAQREAGNRQETGRTDARAIDKLRTVAIAENSIGSALGTLACVALFSAVAYFTTHTTRVYHTAVLIAPRLPLFAWSGFAAVLTTWVLAGLGLILGGREISGWRRGKFSLGFLFMGLTGVPPFLFDTYALWLCWRFSLHNTALITTLRLGIVEWGLVIIIGLMLAAWPGVRKKRTTGLENGAL